MPLLVLIENFLRSQQVKGKHIASKKSNVFGPTFVNPSAKLTKIVVPITILHQKFHI